MTLLVLYGLLAVGTFSVSLAAKTPTIWKLGLIFLLGWIAVTLVNFNVPSPYRAWTFGVIYFIMADFAYKVFIIYKCNTAFILALLFITSMTSCGYFILTNEYTPYIIVNNALFVVEALAIISASITRILSKDRRYINVGHKGKERRKSHNVEKFDHEFLGHHVK